MKRPNFCTDEHLKYLDKLRESGVTNMFGATPFVAKRFGFSDDEAGKILLYWMDSFASRLAESERRKEQG